MFFLVRERIVFFINVLSFSCNVLLSSWTHCLVHERGCEEQEGFHGAPLLEVFQGKKLLEQVVGGTMGGQGGDGRWGRGW